MKRARHVKWIHLAMLCVLPLPHLAEPDTKVHQVNINEMASDVSAGASTEAPRDETAGGGTSRGETPEGKTPRGESPEGKTSGVERPEGKTPRGERLEGKTPRGETSRDETPGDEMTSSHPVEAETSGRKTSTGETTTVTPETVIHVPEDTTSSNTQQKKPVKEDSSSSHSHAKEGHDVHLQQSTDPEGYQES
ncbi:uncharacterized protein LOC106151727, partial [Lingula anatina]|uniref:Uncharacterized protein LOC106151727 n=1 Tax=Lingula anatina TaxID=7574 RepID=A0A1S3H518_LINAN